MKKYKVLVKEVHYRYYEVNANHEEEAKRFVDEREGVNQTDGTLSVKDIGILEFSHEEPIDDWIVEEIWRKG